MSELGKLYLIPCSLGDEADLGHLSPLIKTTISQTNVFIVEEIKTARRFIKRLVPEKNIDQLVFNILNEHTPPNEINNYLGSAENGKNIGLLSEAGCPAIADPGNSIVQLAHKKNIKVVPLVGPSSILLALMASGFNGQNFCFNGYLPKEGNERRKKIKELERLVTQKNTTQIFIETPYRNNQLLDDLLASCENSTLLCIATDVTLNTEQLTTKTVANWRKVKPDLNKRPTVFLIGR
jgi:16S rRNA (cytidine1402-2'-O)-methyltransferase